MSTETGTLKTSAGGTLASNLFKKTCRQIIAKGDATVTTRGTSGFDVITLKNATLDTAYTAASLSSPILLGVDQIDFKPLQYPELAGE